MVLMYESDPLDDEHARGRFYHVCRGRIDQYTVERPAGTIIRTNAHNAGLISKPRIFS